LATAKRKDSQGICFVGKVDLPEFLQQKLEPWEGDIIEIDGTDTPNEVWKPGQIEQANPETLKSLCSAPRISIEMGRKIGIHRGAHFYTIGQRKGLNVGGKAEPLFVLATDIRENIVYVGQGHGHPLLNRFGLFIPFTDIHWLREDLRMHPGEKRNYQVRIRYRQPLQQATLFMEQDGLYIVFENAQRGITPGQFAVWYDSDELLGSGVIC